MYNSRLCSSDGKNRKHYDGNANINTIVGLDCTSKYISNEILEIADKINKKFIKRMFRNNYTTLSSAFIEPVVHKTCDLPF